MSAVQDLSLDQLDVISAKHYGENGYPHEEWARLRRESPVHLMRPPGYKPFWAITKHADIIEVSKQPGLFRSAGRFILMPEAMADSDADLEAKPPLRMLVNMDPPEHRDYRALVSRFFTPRSVARLEARLDEITAEIFDDMAAAGGDYECDFVSDIAARQPLRMITELLGIPREDEDFVLRITNENFGLEDPEFQREGEGSQDRLGFLQEASVFLSKIIAECRANPREGDLSSALANAKLGDDYVPPFELFSLYFLIMVAGHDTTRNAISGGLQALLEHPDQLEKLRSDPSLVDTAAEEIVRWTTPVNHFSRTATRDTVLRGQPIREGDSLGLFYASANRDEEIYDDPFQFRIDRNPNPHLGFGVGEHFCLGAHLARLDLRVFFRHFVERVESVERTSPVELLHASFVGGPKHMPVRFRVRPR